MTGHFGKFYPVEVKTKRNLTLLVKKQQSPIFARGDIGHLWLIFY